MADQKSLFDMMNPKQAFLFGIVEGILVLCTIGFFILLLGGDAAKTTTRTTNTNPVAQQPTGDAPAPTAAASIPGVTADDHIRGNANADIVIVEYSDIECPFCSRFHDTMKQVIDTYGDDVAWVYRHFPLESIHPNARMAANAVECAADQGEDFWEFADALFAAQALGLSKANVLGIAADLGYNTSKLEGCIDAGTFNTLITQQSQDAQAAGGRGTPFSVLIGPNGEQVPISGAQPFATVEATIQQFFN